MNLKMSLEYWISLPLAGLFRLLARLLPPHRLYGLAPALRFFIFAVLRYRIRVIETNLQKAFPEKSNKEIRQLRKAFCTHFAEWMLETASLLHMDEARFKSRCRFAPETSQLLKELSEGKQSFVFLLGHYGNWEWVSAACLFYYNIRVVTAYKPLKNKVFDRLIVDLRSRFLHALIPADQLVRSLVSLSREGKPVYAGLIADQSPPPRHAYWVDFLNQDTAVFSGTEKLIRMLKWPVYFLSTRKQGRGEYLIHLEPMAEQPKDLPEGALSRMFMQRLEKEIRQAPQYWLWSHRRWKHRRENHADAAPL